jgi:hypothetical protein
LRTSVQDLTKVNVEQNGVGAVRDALVRVQTSFQVFVAEAKATFGPQIDQLRATLNSLQSTLQSASPASGGSPSAEQRAAIRANIAAVAAAFSSLQTSVSPNCP